LTDGGLTGGVAPKQLRPLGIGEVLDAAIKLYRANARSLWTIVLLVIVPVAIIDELAVYASIPSLHYVHDGTLYVQGGLGAFGLIVEVVLGLLGLLVLNGAVAICLVDAYIGNPIDWRTSLRAAVGRLGPLVWLAILYGVLIVIGFVALVLPGIYLVTIWCVAVPALMFEGLGGFKALGRSFDLTRGRWWATFATLLAAIVMLVIVLFVVGFVFAKIQSGLSVGSVGPWLLLRAINTIVSDLIIYPFFGAVVAVIYIDLRVRKEGLDLELLAGALGRPSPSGVTPSPLAGQAQPFGAQPAPTAEAPAWQPTAEAAPAAPSWQPAAEAAPAAPSWQPTAEAAPAAPSWQPTAEAPSPVQPQSPSPPQSPLQPAPEAGPDTAVQPSPLADQGATVMRPVPSFDPAPPQAPPAPPPAAEPAPQPAPEPPGSEPGAGATVMRPVPGTEPPASSPPPPPAPDSGATVIRPVVPPAPQPAPPDEPTPPDEPSWPSAG
jgi:hypothetical protein